MLLADLINKCYPRRSKVVNLNVWTLVRLAIQLTGDCPSDSRVVVLKIRKPICFKTVKTRNKNNGVIPSNIGRPRSAHVRREE